MKINSQIPILSRGRDMKKARNDHPGTVLQEMIDLDVLATDIYTLYSIPTLPNARGEKTLPPHHYGYRIFDFISSSFALPPAGLVELFPGIFRSL